MELRRQGWGLSGGHRSPQGRAKVGTGQAMRSLGVHLWDGPQPRYHWGCWGIFTKLGSRGPTLTKRWAGDVLGVEYVGEVGECPPPSVDVEGGLESDTGRGTGLAMGGGGGGGSMGVGRKGLWTFP